jgi:hypothetical protein
VRALPPRYRRVLVDRGLLRLSTPATSVSARTHNMLQAADPQCLMNASPDAVVAAQIASAAHLDYHTPLQVGENAAFSIFLDGF